MFLPGPLCSNCVGRQIYNSTQSSTAKDLGTNAILRYGKGQVSGELFIDDVIAGGFEVSAPRLPVGALTDNGGVPPIGC